MSQPPLIFLNSTGVPALSRANSRQMRAHVTRTNFANRRRRKAEAEPEQGEGESLKQVVYSRKTVARQTSRPSNGALSSAGLAYNSSSFPLDQLVRMFRFLVFQDTRPALENPDEIAWLDLLTSEPAAFEATLSGGMKSWSPSPEVQQSAALHLSNAMNHVLRHLDYNQTASDGVMCAVLTLAFGERLANNDIAWNVHMEGLMQMMQQRHQQGKEIVPPIICSLMAYDFINHLIGFPRLYHHEIANILGNHGYKTMASLCSISNDISFLRQTWDSNTSWRVQPWSSTKEIEERVGRVQVAAKAMQTDKDQYARIASWTIALYLGVRWPLLFPANLDMTACNLRDALGELCIKQCPYMELTSYHELLGAFSARKESQTRLWFLDKIKGSARTLHQRGWETPLQPMKKGLEKDFYLSQQLGDIWSELNIDE